VTITEKNLFNSLFTLCTFDNSEGHRRKGVLVQAKYDSHSSKYMLLCRQIQMKQSQQEKFEWVPLNVPKKDDPTTMVTHFQADLFRGFVSLDYFKALDNTFSTGVKLRSKHLDFVSHEQICIQISKQLNVLAYKSIEEAPLETADDQSRISAVVSRSAYKSEHSFVDLSVS